MTDNYNVCVHSVQFWSVIKKIKIKKLKKLKQQQQKQSTSHSAIKQARQQKWTEKKKKDYGEKKGSDYQCGINV